MAKKEPIHGTRPRSTRNTAMRLLGGEERKEEYKSERTKKRSPTGRYVGGVVVLFALPPYLSIMSIRFLISSICRVL